MRTQRQFVDRLSQTRFLEGVKELLDENKLRKVRLLRLSVKTDHRNRNSIESTWGYVGRTLMAKFIINITKNIDDITEGDWKKYGNETAEDFKNWAANQQELDTLERKYQALQFDIWKTSADWDLAQDLINDIETEFSPHINGKFHWLVRKALTEAIAELMKRSRSDHEKALSRQENIDLLKNIIQNSSITLKTPAPKSKPKVTEGV